MVREEIQAELEREYCPPIDTATLLAISADFDLTDESQLKEAREILDVIKLTAADQDASGFDASGSSGFVSYRNEDDLLSLSDEGSVSARSHAQWASTTDDTSLSQGMSSLDLEVLGFSADEGLGAAYTSELEGLDEAGKESLLMAMFPALKQYDIKLALKKYQGNANLAIDELMTQSFLEESGHRHRGVEGFSESEILPRPRKGKGKRKRIFRTDGTNASPSDDSVQTNKWERGRRDIEFICSRTRMPMQQITSIYHENGGSVRSTITAIIEAHSAMRVESDDPMIQINAHELGQEFPSISPSDINTLIDITHPSTAHAHELAKVLVSSQISNKHTVQLKFHHAPLDLDPEPVKSRPKSHNAVHPNDSGARVNPLKAAANATKFHRARDASFIKASAAYRKGKSDHLMGGAAAYYSEQGRDFDIRAKSAASAAADALVAKQSSKNHLDLHGINVKDAVRISSEKVNVWWHGLGESRYNGRGFPGLRIVTGVGNHSEGGKSKLGPAVGKMLIREGWNVQVERGTLFVTGVLMRK